MAQTSGADIESPAADQPAALFVAAQRLAPRPEVLAVNGAFSDESPLHEPFVGLLRRGQQLERLRAGVGSPLVVLTAPAGYGKTTLLRQWAEADSREFAWVTPRADVDDPMACMAYLAQALHLLDAQLLAGPLDDAVFWSSVALPRFGEVVQRYAEPFVLVMDDVQQFEGPAAWEVISTLQANLPEGSQLVLSGRTEPFLPLGHHQAHRRLLWLTEADLALSPDEGRAMLRLLGFDLDPDDAARLVERAEGWAAGVCLAGLALQGRNDAKQAIARFDGGNRIVADHVHAEILAALPNDVTSFLTRTSVLGTLSGPLCDAVLQQTGSGLMLERINRANLMLFPVDRHEQTYRYHALFAETLQAELARTEPDLVAVLHRRASDWHAEAGTVDEAIRHAQAAGDISRSGELVWTHLASYLATGRRTDVERWLDGFPEEQTRSDPLLALTAASCALTAGREVAHWLRAAEACQREVPDHLPSVPLAIALLRAVLVKGGPDGMAVQAKRAYHLASPDDPSRALAAHLAGVAYSFQDDFAAALKWLEAGDQLATLLGVPAMRAACLGQQAILAFHDDDWIRADALTAGAMTIVEDCDLVHVKTMAPIYAASALSMAHQHRRDEAQRAARQARRMAAEIGNVVKWQAHQTRTLLARAYLLLGDNDNAQLLIDEAREAAGPGASDLRRDLDEMERLTRVIPVSGQTGPASITAAERRVLQLLNTHLSFAEIGDLLFRSRNTVKTQAISIYRKLDVGSRGEAVEQATKLGLD